MNAAQAVFVDRDPADLSSLWRSWRLALVGAIAGALFATLVPPAFVQARDAVDRVAAELTPPPPPARVVKGPELTREWRWSPPGVNVESMYGPVR